MPDQSCFVIMPFARDFEDYYHKIIKPLVEAYGIKCLRADEIYLPTSIYKDICEQIQQSRFLIADLSGRNANVNYELGLAHALQKPVIILSQVMDDVPVDFRNLRVIVYSNSDSGKQLGEKLKLSIDSLLQEKKISPIYPFKNPYEEQQALLMTHLREMYIQSHYILSQSNVYEVIDQKKTRLSRTYTIMPKTSMSHFFQVFKLDDGSVGNFKIISIKDVTTNNDLRYIIDEYSDTMFKFCILLNNLEPSGKPFMIKMIIEIADYFRILFESGEDFFGEMPININKVHISYISIEETILLPDIAAYQAARLEIQNDPVSLNNNSVVYPELKNRKYVLKHKFYREDGFVSGFGFRIFL